jgi:hypothetical protein
MVLEYHGIAYHGNFATPARRCPPQYRPFCKTLLIHLRASIAISFVPPVFLAKFELSPRRTFSFSPRRGGVRGAGVAICFGTSRLMAAAAFAKAALHKDVAPKSCVRLTPATAIRTMMWRWRLSQNLPESRLEQHGKSESAGPLRAQGITSDCRTTSPHRPPTPPRCPLTTIGVLPTTIDVVTAPSLDWALFGAMGTAAISVMRAAAPVRAVMAVAVAVAVLAAMLPGLLEGQQQE